MPDGQTVGPRAYPAYGGTGGYRTYSLPYYLGAPASELTSRYGVAAGADRLVRITELENPGSTYVMVEENDNRDYSMDAWAFDPYKFILIYTIAVFHNRARARHRSMTAVARRTQGRPMLHAGGTCSGGGPR